MLKAEGVVCGDGTRRDWPDIQPACPMGVNETRGKLRIVRTIIPILEEERKREGKVSDSSVPPSRLLVGVMTHPRVGKVLCPARGCVIVINLRHGTLEKHEIAKRTV